MYIIICYRLENFIYNCQKHILLYLLKKEKKIMKLIKVYLLSFVTLIMANAPVSADSVLHQILSSGVLQAGTTGDFYPFSKRDVATNGYEGFDIDVLTELAKDMGVEIEFVPTDWKTLVAGVVAGNYVITGSAGVQAKRAKAAGYSESYMSVVVRAFKASDEAATASKKAQKEFGNLFEKNAEDWFPNSKLTKIEAPARGYQEVLAGRSEVFITSNVEGGTLLSKYPNLRAIEVDGRNPTPLAMLVPQADQVWINYVNHWINIKQAKGFFAATAAKYGL